MIFYKEFFYNGLFLFGSFLKHFFKLTTDKKSAEIEITIKICWFKYLAALC